MSLVLVDLEGGGYSKYWVYITVSYFHNNPWSCPLSSKCGFRYYHNIRRLSSLNAILTVAMFWR